MGKFPSNNLNLHFRGEILNKLGNKQNLIIIVTLIYLQICAINIHKSIWFSPQTVYVICHAGNSHAKKRCQVDSSCLGEHLRIISSRFLLGYLTCFGKMSLILITSVFPAVVAPVNAPAGIAPRAPFIKGFLTQS